MHGLGKSLRFVMAAVSTGRPATVTALCPGVTQAAIPKEQGWRSVWVDVVVGVVGSIVERWEGISLM